ncbi:MAG: hypothetical protein KAV83_04005 [Desulfobacterales bacterium]|nr:hypothetical protein [Desulfobacterales bacterium]
MSIQPEGEDLRKATKWISDKLRYEQNVSMARAIEEACMKFDLPPKDCEFLMRFFAKRSEG